MIKPGKLILIRHAPVEKKEGFLPEHNPEAIKVVPINMILRSILSDKYPIGHWESAPKELIMTINIEISNSPSSLEAAYTAPYPKTAL